MTRPTVDVLSPLLSAPSIPPAAAHQLLAGLDLAPRTVVPAWITDLGLRRDIEDGFADIPDDLRGDQ
ncbi:hypothetical protein ACIGO8_08330 [Streptomyces sp. NPDC053493]|uniref:hypothetical protein n=1 Tax=Streptomyces sp. NPDC053493 TaxID=3365705 RepID=UPI0037CE1804